VARGRLADAVLGTSSARAQDDVGRAYEDDGAEMRAESLMTDEAMRIATGDDRRYDWSGGLVSRDLWNERAAMMRDLATAMKDAEDD